MINSHEIITRIYIVLPGILLPGSLAFTHRCFCFWLVGSVTSVQKNIRLHPSFIYGNTRSCRQSSWRSVAFVFLSGTSSEGLLVRTYIANVLYSLTDSIRSFPRYISVNAKCGYSSILTKKSRPFKLRWLVSMRYILAFSYIWCIYGEPCMFRAFIRLALFVENCHWPEGDA